MNENEQRDELARVEAAAKGIMDDNPFNDEPNLWEVPSIRAHYIAIASAALAAADAVDPRKPRTITTMEELDALPVGSVVLARWSDNSQPDYQMTRCPEGAASAGGGFGVAGGSHWLNMASWGATLTILHEPEAEATR